MRENRGFKREKDPSDSNRKKRRNHLLVIGIDEYKSIQPLENAVGDAKAVAEVLLRKYRFYPSDTVELYNEEASRSNIISALDLIAERVSDDDNLLIYFAGHGYFRKRLRIGYWVPVDGKKRSYASFINHSTIRDYIRAIPTHHTLLIVDSCFSGDLLAHRGRNISATVNYANKVDVFPSRWCLAAGMIEKVSDGLIGDHSPFAKSLLTYLKRNNRIRFPVQELINHVTKATSYNADQTPIGGVILKTGDQNGQFVFELKNQEEAIAEREWESTLNSDSIDAYDRFLKKYPNSVFSPEAKKKLVLAEELKSWIEARGKNIVNAYKNFVRENQAISLKRDAQSALRRLRQKPKVKKVNRESSIEMIRIEGGSFLMGSNEFDDEGPIHRVKLDSFELGKYPITQGQWTEIMGSNPSHFKGSKDLPVDSISWEDAEEFILRLNQRYPGNNYRLPTEAEWEYAARGGEKSKNFKYSGGNDADKVGWYWRNSGDRYMEGKWEHERIIKNNCRTHIVGQKRPNELGIYDMAGNVWEWCEDWFGSYGSKVQRNPYGPKSGSRRVLRGGSWFYYQKPFRVANRYSHKPTSNFNFFGFRLAK